MADDPTEIVGVRYTPLGPLEWYRAGTVPARAGDWVVAERDGAETVGQVIVGRGQCVGFPDDPAALPELLRAAGSDEVPRPHEGAAKRLLDSLP